MLVNDLVSFIKKKGFRDTFEVLAKYKNFKTDKKTFYNELNKFSYYNSFFRVKEELIETGLIRIEPSKNNGKKYILLTEKGQEVYNKLLEVNDILKN